MPDTNNQRLIFMIYVIRNTVYDFCHCEEQSDEAISSTSARSINKKWSVIR